MNVVNFYRVTTKKAGTKQFKSFIEALKFAHRHRVSVVAVKFDGTEEVIAHY